MERLRGGAVKGGFALPRFTAAWRAIRGKGSCTDSVLCLRCSGRLRPTHREWGLGSRQRTLFLQRDRQRIPIFPARQLCHLSAKCQNSRKVIYFNILQKILDFIKKGVAGELDSP